MSLELNLDPGPCRGNVTVPSEGSSLTLDRSDLVKYFLRTVLFAYVGRIEETVLNFIDS